jgi:hypothetical protein
MERVSSRNIISNSPLQASSAMPEAIESKWDFLSFPLTLPAMHRPGHGEHVFFGVMFWTRGARQASQTLICRLNSPIYYITKQAVKVLRFTIVL